MTDCIAKKVDSGQDDETLTTVHIRKHVEKGDIDGGKCAGRYVAMAEMLSASFSRALCM
jgi:hypothetical protein